MSAEKNQAAPAEALHGREQSAPGDLKCDFLGKADRAFIASTERFERYIAGLDDEPANWSPRPGIWSVAACMEHLVKSSEIYFANIEAALNKGRAAGRTGGEPYGNGTFMGRFFLGVVNPDRAQFKAVKAPGLFLPRTGAIDFGEMSERFRAVQKRWSGVLRAADGLALGRIRLATPLSPFIRMTAAQAIQLHAWHEPRHLEQAERLTGHPDFPL